MCRGTWDLVSPKGPSVTEKGWFHICYRFEVFGINRRVSRAELSAWVSLNVRACIVVVGVGRVVVASSRVVSLSVVEAFTVVSV